MRIHGLTPEYLWEVEDLVESIQERNWDAVGFVPDVYALDTIKRYIDEKKYTMILYMFGKFFLLELLESFEMSENYEECAEIVKQINEHNILTRDCITTKLK